MWNILVAILQDNFVPVEDDPGNPIATDCAAMISDKIWMVMLFEELQGFGFSEKYSRHEFHLFFVISAY